MIVNRNQLPFRFARYGRFAHYGDSGYDVPNYVMDPGAGSAGQVYPTPNGLPPGTVLPGYLTDPYAYSEPPNYVADPTRQGVGAPTATGGSSSVGGFFTSLFDGALKSYQTPTMNTGISYPYLPGQAAPSSGMPGWVLPVGIGVGALVVGALVFGGRK